MGAFVVVDGIDGSGKGVVIDAFREWCEANKLRVINLRDFYSENGCFPSEEALGECDAIFSSEPSYGCMGRAISEEMLKNANDYSVVSVAWAFALDREVLYNKVIITALKQGKYVFQERGVSSSLVYQPVQGRISFKELIQMPGNRLALKHAPNLLIITRVEPQLVVERMKEKGELQEGVFRRLSFQRKVDQRYASGWLKQLFERFKTKVVYLDTNPPKSIEQTKSEVLQLWQDFKK
ncbi:MAG: hypothetical protein ABIG95_03075 [Candidatus Woesearchaeota archaeon]